MIRAAATACMFLASACATGTGVSFDADGVASVQAVRETTPVATSGDAADDPAIWRNPADPSKSLIIGTDKEWGLHAYDLTGALVASVQAGKVNNVDLRSDVTINGKPGVLVAASDRTEDPKGRIALYALETSPVSLRRLGHPSVESDGVGEVYGFCLWRRAADAVFAIIPFNNGDVRTYALDLSGDTPTATLVRDVKLGSQTEGCVVDDRTGLLYVAEEEIGIWRMSADPQDTQAPVMIARIDGVNLIPDIEGLAIIPEGETGGHLIASSQADSAGGGGKSTYAAYDLETDQLTAHFRVTGSGKVDGATDTDGLEFADGDFGAPFEDGLFVVQDGDNAPDNQNFKLVPGDAIKQLLKK